MSVVDAPAGLSPTALLEDCAVVYVQSRILHHGDRTRDPETGHQLTINLVASNGVSKSKRHLKKEKHPT
jgi:hypothetical protein